MGQSCSASPNNPGAGPPIGASGPRGSGGKSLQGRLPGAPPSTTREWTSECAEPVFPIQIATFKVRHRGRREGTAAASAQKGREGFRRWYSLGRELGRGVSATVFEAEALTTGYGGISTEKTAKTSGFCSGASGLLPTCTTERGRRVAVKRFKKVGSRSFQTELAALLRIGVHPNVLRLLETYEDIDGEDVLVLELCDGSTIFDLYAQARKRGELLTELLVVRLVRQLLLALEHIVSCGVEHQDVKPENMLLYDLSIEDHRAGLKLGDFGWATTASTTPTSQGGTRLDASGRLMISEPAPAEGAGSLWYAPPELNPPVPGRDPSTSPADPRPLGGSDMWSVGVVIYLLLVGQNPFNAALKLKGNKAIEAEVLRLVDQGLVDTSCPRWLDLAADARDFVMGMLQVDPQRRPCPTEALRDPYIVRRLARCSEAAPPEPAWRWADREDAWSRLDGFQRLSWAAVVRAVAEPELAKEVAAAAARATRTTVATRGCGGSDAAYLWRLAREISATPAASWIQDNNAWPEVLRLAFRYLDNDDDGILSPQDIVKHLVPLGVDAAVHADAWSAAHLWVSRWTGPAADAAPSSAHGCGRALGPRSTGLAGLGPAHFRSALLASSADSSWMLSRTMDQYGEEVETAPGLNLLRRAGLGAEEELCGWGDFWK